MFMFVNSSEIKSESDSEKLTYKIRSFCESRELFSRLIANPADSILLNQSSEVDNR
jgi:hypothetical protein